MPLARHVDPDELLEKLRNSSSKAHHHPIRDRSANSELTPYSTRYNARDPISRFHLPQQGAPVSSSRLCPLIVDVDSIIQAEAVRQMIKDELDLDGRPNLNLASFVGTYMEREAEDLMIESQ